MATMGNVKRENIKYLGLGHGLYSSPPSKRHDSTANDPALMWFGFKLHFENDDVRIIFVRSGFIENPYITRATPCTAMKQNFKNPIENGLSVTRRTFPGEEMKSRV